MEITEVKVFPVSEEKLKAFVSIVLDCCFMVNDIKVIRGKDGLFISMPSRKKKNGEFKDVAHPLNNETRRKIEIHVLEEYERVLRERGEAPEVGRRRLKIDDQRGPVRPAAGPAPAFAADGEGARPAAAAAASPEPDEEGSKEGKSLEEIQEMHLRDSFWSVS